MKKKALALLLIICLIIQPVIHSEAKDKSVTIGSVSMTSDSATVSGTTEAFAVMVRITDSSSNIVSMQSFGVSADGSFFANIRDLTLADGTYTISVADYEGGTWDTKTATVGSTQSNDQPVIYTPTETTPVPAEPVSPSPEPEKTSVSTFEPSFTEIIKKEESDTVTAVFDAGLIGEKEVEIPVILNPENEDDAALIDALFTEEEKASFSGEPVEIILSVSTTKPSKSEEKAADECVTALEDILSGKATEAEDLDIPEELQSLFNGAAAAARNDSGDGKATQNSSGPEIAVAAAYDFSVQLKVGDNPPVEIHDLGNVKMVVNFLIDKKLKNNDPLTQRIFLMIHLMEDGRREILPVDVDEKTMSAGVAFGSCSTFILAYVDVAKFTTAGEKLTSKKYNANYRVVAGGDTNGKVGVLEYTGPIKNKAKHIVHSRVTVNNITYKVKSIAADAFKGNKTLEEITIGQFVTSIGSKAFYGCTGLKTVTIGKRVSKIGDKAFCKAKVLEDVIIESKKLKSKNIGTSVWTKAGTAGDGITFSVPSSKLKSYRKLFGKIGTVEAK